MPYSATLCQARPLSSKDYAILKVGNDDRCEPSRPVSYSSLCAVKTQEGCTTAHATATTSLCKTPPTVPSRSSIFEMLLPRLPTSLHRNLLGFCSSLPPWINIDKWLNKFPGNEIVENAELIRGGLTIE